MQELQSSKPGYGQFTKWRAVPTCTSWPSARWWRIPNPLWSDSLSLATHSHVSAECSSLITPCRHFDYASLHLSVTAFAVCSKQKTDSCMHASSDFYFERMARFNTQKIGEPIRLSSNEFPAGYLAVSFLFSFSCCCASSSIFRKRSISCLAIPYSCISFFTCRYSV